MKIPVLIVPTLFHYDLLQNMLNSIDIEVEEIIIIDNGGKLNSIQCNMANKISIINMPRNLGVATSWNLGIQLTPYAKWWLIASDDIEFIPGTLSKIAKSNFSTFIFDKTASRIFSSFAIHENVVESVGLFNEYFYPGIGEEFDYLDRISNLKIKVYTTKFFKDINNGGNTINKFFDLSNNKIKELFVQNIKLINNKKLDHWDLTYRRYIENIMDFQY